MPGILSLPNEILLDILERARSAAEISFSDPRGYYSAIGNIRRSCHRLCDLITPIISYGPATIDISRPDTLRRFRNVADNPLFVKSIREVDLYLRFYHSWPAASIENFTSAILTEWLKRNDRWGRRRDEEVLENRDLGFDDLMHVFLESLQKFRKTDEAVREDQKDNRPIRNIWQQTIVTRAYQDYRKGYEAQSEMLRDGSFAQIFAEAVSKLPDFRQLHILDGEKNNNWGPVAGIQPVKWDDLKAQEDILVQVLSRPMLWEEVQWVFPDQSAWSEVPVQLLMDIPITMAQIDNMLLSYLSVEVSAPPTYMSLLENPGRLEELAAAMASLDIYQVMFQPRCRSGCGPWPDGENAAPGYITKPMHEYEAINKYLGALLHPGSFCLDVNLGEFWFSAGMDGRPVLPCSVGAAFPWPTGCESMNVNLTSVVVTMSELEAIASAVQELDLSLTEVHLRIGTWRHTLNMLREKLDKLRGCSISWPSGGGADELENVDFDRIFRWEDRLADKFVMGENDVNPLDRYPV